MCILSSTPDPATVSDIFKKKMAASASMGPLEYMKRQNADIILRPMLPFMDAQNLQEFIRKWKAYE